VAARSLRRLRLICRGWAPTLRAAGAIIGALLPTTEHEDRLLGEMRNKTAKDAAQKSRALYETARENAASYSVPDAGRTDDDASRARTSRPH